MKNKNRPFFYEKKKTPFRIRFLAALLAVGFLLFMGLQAPRVRQVIAQPLFAAASFTVNTAKDFFAATRMYHEPEQARQTYTPLELPDEQVLFAESLESLSIVTQADPLADLRLTPTESEYGKVAEWEYLDPNLNYAIRSNGAVIEDDVQIDLLAPVFERADVNNNGAAILSALMRYWKEAENQYRIAEMIHPDALDPVISPADIQSFVEEAYPGFNVITRINGDSSTLTALLRQNIPPLIQIRYRTPYSYWLHDDREACQYILILGYNSQSGTFTYQDSYTGKSNQIPEADLLAAWYPFQRIYMAIYPMDLDESVQEALSENYYEELNNQNAELKFRTDSEMLPENPYAQYNYGYILHRIGDEHGAWEYFSRALSLSLPQRYISCRPEIFETAMELGYADDIDELAAPLLRRNSHDEILTLYRGWAALLRGDTKDGAKLIEKAEKINPNNEKVRYAVKYIETMIQ